MDGEGLLGETQFSLEPRATKEYKLFFSPL